MSVTEGSLLAGRYTLGPELGSGGMSEVRLAHDVRLGRTVAVKVLRRDLARDPAFQARFRREAQAAASLNAPSIASVYDTGQDDDGVPFIVMERVEGRTLRDVLHEEGRLLPERALEIVADLCAALEVAHRSGIVHRDVKPGNVMLTPSGEVKVMDFGIARAVADSGATMTQTASVIGTAAYLSPEQARGENVDARSDLYAAGCVLYELITGSPPFNGDSPVAIAYQHVREDPLPPTRYDATLPPAVDAVVLKAMAKNPANRYQSAQQMREDLLRAARGEPVEATPVLVDGAPTTIVPTRETIVLRDPGPGTARQVFVYTAFGLALVGIAASVALLVRALLGNDTGYVQAPELVGRSQQQAIESLADAGLKIGELTVRFADRPAGTVLAQNPDDGFTVQRGGSVDLVVSRGIDRTTVPYVVGLQREDAAALLQKYRLGIAEVQYRDGNAPAGLVLSSDPGGGQVERAGRDVTLVVASGRVAVPDVRGRSQDEAVAMLRSAGLSVAVQPVPTNGAPGRVIDQAPLDTTLDRGSVVTIGVSVTPPPQPSPTFSPSPSPPPPPQPSPTPSLAASPTASPSPPVRATPSPSPSR